MFGFLEGVLGLTCAGALLTAVVWRGHRMQSTAMLITTVMIGGLVQEARRVFDPEHFAANAAKADRERVDQERARAHQVAVEVLAATEHRRTSQAAAFQREMTERQARLERRREKERQRNLQKLAEIERLELTPVVAPRREREELVQNHANIVASIIAQSRASYPGNCGCPDDRDRAGRRCGGRSAYSRAGGRSVICYERDVTPDMLLAATGASRVVDERETEIPRSMPDGGRYYLVEMKRDGERVEALHKRVGAKSVDWSREEINCTTGRMRGLGESDVGPSSIKWRPTNWFALVPGSSKSDLFNFVCGS